MQHTCQGPAQSMPLLKVLHARLATWPVLARHRPGTFCLHKVVGLPGFMPWEFVGLLGLHHLPNVGPMTGKTGLRCSALLPVCQHHQARRSTCHAAPG